MSIAGHLDALKRKHVALEQEIAEVMSRPAPDQSVLSRLKKEKLRLKEEIERFAGDGETRH